MDLVGAFRKHQREADIHHVIIVGTSEEAGRNGRSEIAEVLMRESRRYDCCHTATMYAEAPADAGGPYVAGLAAYLEREVLGTGTRKRPAGRVYELSRDSLRWTADGRYRRDLTVFAAEATRLIPDPGIRCLVILTDLTGFRAVTGRRSVYLGLCSVDVEGLRSNQPRISRLHSQLDADVAKIANLIPS